MKTNLRFFLRVKIGIEKTATFFLKHGEKPFFFFCTRPIITVASCCIERPLASFPPKTLHYIHGHLEFFWSFADLTKAISVKGRGHIFALEIQLGVMKYHTSFLFLPQSYTIQVNEEEHGSKTSGPVVYIIYLLRFCSLYNINYYT